MAWRKKPMVPLQLQPKSDVTLYVQLRDQLRALVHTGDLRPGDRIPASRELANQLGVHRTTVANAYAELESEGLIQGHVGRGTFICGNGHALKLTPPAPPVLNGNGLIRGDSVALENPTYPGAIAIFSGARGRCLAVPVRTHAGPDEALGLDLESLEATLMANRVKLIVVTPDFQNPTGTSMPMASRRRLLELAARHQVPVIEDHVYARLSAREERVPSLKQLDRTNAVIHIARASKAASPRLRVGSGGAPAE